MIMRDIPGTPECPECGSENVRSKWSLTTIVAWVGRILGVPTVKIFEKRCLECGNEFQVFRK
jgi:predicted nucleic-acid-binding Zn-ribbon protein